MKTLYPYAALVFTALANSDLVSSQAVYLDDPLVHTSLAVISFGLGSLCCWFIYVHPLLQCFSQTAGGRTFFAERTHTCTPLTFLFNVQHMSNAHLLHSTDQKSKNPVSNQNKLKLTRRGRGHTGTGSRRSSRHREMLGRCCCRVTWNAISWTVAYLCYIPVIFSLISRKNSDQEEVAVSSTQRVHLCRVPQPPNRASAIQQDIVKTCIFWLFQRVASQIASYFGSEVVVFGLVNVATLFGLYSSDFVFPLPGQHLLFQL